jgi:fumarate reductase subunit D
VFLKISFDKVLYIQSSNVLPDVINDLLGLLGPGGSNASEFIVDRLKFVLFLALGAVVLVAVVYSIMAAYKYIRSQGDPGKIDEAQKAIKAIFMGLAALSVAVVGVVLIFLFFGLDTPESTLPQVCISAPSSVGCKVCQQDSGSTTCTFCEAAYRARSVNDIPDVDGNGVIEDADIRGIRRINGVENDGKNCVSPSEGGNL